MAATELPDCHNPQARSAPAATTFASESDGTCDGDRLTLHIRRRGHMSMQSKNEPFKSWRPHPRLVSESTNQFAHALAEHFRMQVDICSLGLRRHQRHIMKRSEQNTAIHG